MVVGFGGGLLVHLSEPSLEPSVLSDIEQFLEALAQLTFVHAGALLGNYRHNLIDAILQLKTRPEESLKLATWTVHHTGAR